jgi:hypothetical protein
MIESDFPQLRPVSFEPVEVLGTSGADGRPYKEINIGNSGGIYKWHEGDTFFEQHFEPDGQITPAEDDVSRRKFATLYPAVLSEFISWQDNLPDSDPRKQIKQIKGSTDKKMSDLRSNLLGDAYGWEVKENPEDPTAPIYSYDIDIEKIKEDPALMQRLRSFRQRVDRLNYETLRDVPVAGETRRNIVITQKEIDAANRNLR